MSPCEVLCIDRASYISAVVALQLMIERLPAEQGAPYVEALADFRRAHAYAMAVDAQIHTPALLRRQI
jgi:hypothetical protein